MQNKPSRLKRWGASIALMALYIQCRAMYFPVFWMGFPAYVDWATFKETKPGTENAEKPAEHFFFITRDLPRLAVVYLYAGLIWFISWVTEWWWPLSLAAVAFVSAVVFAYNWVIMRYRMKKFIRLRDLEEATEQSRTDLKI